MIDKYFNNLFIPSKVTAYLIFFFILCIIILSTGCKDGNKLSRSSVGENASSVVAILDSVYIKSLDRWRNIRIYLPKQYNINDQSFPVLYMLDGQNLFDDSTSYAGEWHIDESMDSLSLGEVIQSIIVGIDNGQERRMNEYNPFDSKRFGPGEGRQTVEFIVNQLKPMVDSMYRTKPQRAYTAIGGSSMGGLMAFYSISYHSDIFSKALVFSPSFWVTEDVEKWISALSKDSKIYMSLGSEEGEEMISGMNRMIELMSEYGFTEDQLRTRVVKGMGHSEKLWTIEFPRAYKFLFGQEQ